MRIFTLGLALLLLLHVAAYGQKPVGKKAFYIHSVLGINNPGTSDLNSALGRSGHLSLPQVYFSRGGGFYLFYGKTRLVQLFNFATYTGKREEGNQRNWVRGTQIGTALGLDLRRRTRLQAIPYAGVAYSLFGLRLSNGNGSGLAFNDFLSGPANQHYIAQNQWLGNVGLHLGASPVGKSGIGQKLDIAVRAGYYLPLSQDNWKTNGEDLNGGPDVNTGGFYAGLVLGLRQ